MSRDGVSEAVRTPLISLDILRALAAFVVLLVHTRSFSWYEYGSLPAAQHSAATMAFWIVTRMGDEAVMVFFVLSGFLVGGGVIERVREGRFQIGAYVIDRATRILIPLAPACLFTAAIAALAMHHPLTVIAVLGNMFGLNGVVVNTLGFNASLWSLSYEIWFYVLAGAVAFWMTRGANVVGALALGACALCFACLGGTFLLFWSLGALMVFALRISRPVAFACAGVVIAAAGSALYEIDLGKASAEMPAPPDVARALLCIGVCFALPFLCRPATNRALAWLRGPAKFASSFSYSLYLFHYPVVMALGLVLPQSHSIDAVSIGYFVLRLAVCILVALAFYLVFERQTPAARRWLTARWARAATAPRPAA